MSDASLGQYASPRFKRLAQQLHRAVQLSSLCRDRCPVELQSDPFAATERLLERRLSLRNALLPSRGLRGVATLHRHHTHVSHEDAEIRRPRQTEICQ